MKTGLKAVLSTLALVAAALWAPAAAAAPAARAAGENPLQYLTVEKTVTAHRQADVNAAAGPATISCTLYATFPLIISPGQKFGPYNNIFYTSVGGAAWITCTAAVAQLSLVAIVDWDGVPVTGLPVQVGGTNQVVAYAIDVCTSGDWSVGASGMVAWPPGYGPPSPLSGMLPPIYIDPEHCA
ncbi:hypothetical protein ACWEIJ_45570 [Lentzea sp. NPDC004789]